MKYLEIRRSNEVSMKSRVGQVYTEMLGAPLRFSLHSIRDIIILYSS